MSSLPFWLLVLVFAAAAAVVWTAGIQLSKTTDVLDTRWRIGSAFGGLIILAIATNLPEIAIIRLKVIASAPPSDRTMRVHTTRRTADQWQPAIRSASPSLRNTAFSVPAARSNTVTICARASLAITIATRCPSGESATSPIRSRAPNAFAGSTGGAVCASPATDMPATSSATPCNQLPCIIFPLAPVASLCARDAAAKRGRRAPATFCDSFVLDDME